MRGAAVVLASLLFILGFASRNSFAVALGVILFALCSALLLLTLWSLGRVDKTTDAEIVDQMYRLSQIRPSDKLLAIGVGLRSPAVAISQHLTNGRIHAVDIYNPQQMPAPSISRARELAQPARTDPRITWYDSSLALLPLPDKSVQAAYLYSILSGIVEEGDKKALLREVSRVLAPHGRILIAEMADSWPNRLLPGSRSIQTPEYWNGLLREAGYELRRAQTVKDIAFCLRADKPSPYAGQQMMLKLGYRDGSS